MFRRGELKRWRDTSKLMLNSGLGRKRGKRGWGELRDIEDRGFTGWEFGEGGKGDNLANCKLSF